MVVVATPNKKENKYRLYGGEKRLMLGTTTRHYYLLMIMLSICCFLAVIYHVIIVSLDHSSSSSIMHNNNNNNNNNNNIMNKHDINPNKPGPHFAFASFLSFQGFEGCYSAPRFIDAAAKLGVSWRRNSNDTTTADMLLLVVDAPCRHLFSMQRLRDIGWKIVWVETPIWYMPKSNERAWSWIAGNRYEHTSQFSKLLLWNFTQYKHILYMDSDILLIRRDPMQYILPLLPFAHRQSLGMDHCNSKVCNPATLQVCNTSECNAGVMLITPSAYEFQRMRLYIPVIAFDRELQEQSFLQHYWTPLYNRTVFGFPASFVAAPHEYKSFSFGAVHFIATYKPWDALLARESKSLSELWNGYCGYASCISD